VAWLTFGTATSPEPMSALDTQFTNVASALDISCTASGTNAVSLTPLSTMPSLSSYFELGSYRFVAVNTTTGVVTLQYNGLGFLPVYHADGVTQANVGDFVANQQYVVTFHQALNSGGGGFYFLNASTPTTSTNYYQPGGRLTLQSATPVMFTNQLTKQVIFYCPYQHPFVPIYNGATMQNYQFTSSLSDQVGIQLNMGGAANFTSGVPFDIFATLISSSPALVATAWTNTTTRATTLSVFGGLLTNAGSMTAQTGPNTSTTVPINQGTYLGSVICNSTGSTNWQFGGTAVGGTAINFLLANYYNTVLFTSALSDSGGSYTYTSSTPRQMRASAGMAAALMLPSSERAVFVAYTESMTIPANTSGTVSCGYGVNTTASYGAFVTTYNMNLPLDAFHSVGCGSFSATGYTLVNFLEGSDGTNANVFSGGSGLVAVWL
jgi:hypothetical protein